MEGIILQNIKPEQFEALSKEVKKVSSLLEQMLDAKSSENLSPEDSADEVGVTTQTIYNWIKEGKLKASKIGRRILIKRCDLEDAFSEVKSLKYKR